MKDKIIEIIESALNEYKLDETKLNKQENIPFLKIIKEPRDFFRSNPINIEPANKKNMGETAYQREIYDSKDESIIWLDMELPIGQKCDGDRGKRVDLIGVDKEGQYIICELKHVKEGGAAKNPFDAVLQVLAYYLMIQNNCDKLDTQEVFHNNARGAFKWKDVASNCRLQIRAPKKYWSNWHKDTTKNRAAKQIIEECRKIGLIIEDIQD